MNKILKAVSIAILLALPVVASAQSFTFSSTGQTPTEAQSKTLAQVQEPQAESRKKLRCGDGEAAHLNAKFFISYIERAGNLYVGKVYACGRDDSLDNEDGMRDLMSRVESFTRGSIAPLMITRLKN